jgi:hypothetical protein
VLGYLGLFFVGLILGLIGGGGSLMAIPILLYLFSFDIVTATAYSLFIVGVTSLIGTIQRYREALVDLRVGLIFGLPSIIAKFMARKYILASIPEVIFRTESFAFSKRLFILSLFTVLVILAASAMILNRSRTEGNRYAGRGSSLWLASLGAAIGLVTGISGLGGGFIIVPTLLFFADIPIKKAIGTSLFLISVSCLIGFTGDLSHLHVSWPFLSGITGIAVLGIFTGNLLSSRLSSLQLKKTFGWFVMIMGIAILIKETWCLLNQFYA